MTAKHTLRSNDGFSAIVDVLCILLVLAMVFAVFYVFYRASSLGDDIRDEAQLMLDAYTVQTGREIVQQIKNGNDYTNIINQHVFLQDFARELNLDQSFTGYQGGELVAQLTNIQTDFVITDRLKTSVTYDVTLPVYFLGSRVLDLNYPVRLESRYNLKY